MNISLKNASVIYKNSDTSEIIGLNKINLDINKTGLFFITGKSGSGKTTLLNAIGGIIKLTDGELFINDQIVTRLNNHEWCKLRNELLGYVFQDNNLISELDVNKNISIPLLLRGNHDSNLIESILNSLNMHGSESRNIQELSTGQKQRIALARAIVNNPPIVLADEPTGNLDTQNSKQIMDILFEMSKDRIVIVVTHDLDMANSYPSTIIEMRDGVITSEVLNTNTRIDTITISNHDKTNSRKIKFSDLNKEIKKFFEESVLDMNITIDDVSQHRQNIEKFDVVHIKQINNQNCSTKVSIHRLPILFKLFIAFSHIRQNLIKVFISTMILAISLFLVFITTLFFTYELDDTISRYLTENEISEVYPVLPYLYTSRFNENIYIEVDRGKKLLDIIGDDQNIFRVFENIGISKYPMDSPQGEATTFVVNNVLIESNSIQYVGTIPSTSDEIMVTESLYEYYFGEVSNPALPQVIYMQNSILSVVGIVLDDIAIRNNTEEYRQFYEMKFGNTIYSMEPLKNYSVYSTSPNFGLYNVYEVPSSLSILDNEVIISSHMATEMGLNVGDILMFDDIHADAYGMRFWDTLNVYDFISNGLNIASIIDSNENYIYISEDTFNTINNEFQSFYANDSIFIQSEDMSEFTHYFYQHGIFIEPGIAKIHDITNYIENNKLVLYPIFIVGIVLSFISTGNSTTNILNKKQREIGILKTLGTREMDIREIFIFQGIFTTIISLTLSIMVYFLTVNYLNNKFKIELIADFDLFITQGLWLISISICFIMLINIMVYLIVSNNFRKTIFDNIYK